MTQLNRRSAIKLAGGIAAASVIGGRAHAAEPKVIRIAISMPFTGSEAEGANLVKDGAVMAIDETNAKGGVAGYKLEVVLMDDGTATAGGYDPAQGATNARKMVTDPTILAAIGPYNSGSGKAMSPILSAASLPIVTPTSTNPDITDPKFAQIYRPEGPAIYFRTVTTDAFQGPNMANFYGETLKAKAVYVLDDSGAYGVGLADAFQAQAPKAGMKVLGRDRLDPKAADYTPIFTKMKSLGVTAMYYGGDAQAGIKVVKQSYDILPGIIKGGGDGMYEPEILTGGGFPAVEGWYATLASPHLLDQPDTQGWMKRFSAKWNKQGGDYSITAYDAALVIIDAIGRVAKTGKPVTRAALRDAIEATHLKTLQGTISFDKNGDLTSRIVSVFQAKLDKGFPPDDMTHQFKYIGVAPQTVSPA
jgi:branched-chain amino acid transport system substrate-binding protein